MTRLILYRDDKGREPFAEWMNRVRDYLARSRIQFRLRMAQLGHLGDVRPVGGGVLEMRIHVGQGYRIYCAPRGDTLVVLLCGGTKSTQTADILLAQRYWADWKGKNS